MRSLSSNEGSSLRGRFKNVFDWLDHVRAHPDMWVRNYSLDELNSRICGYYVGLHVQGIVESVPQMGHHFMTWLGWRNKKYLDSRGWATAIDQRHPDPEKAFAVFFKFVDEYRQLKTTCLWTADVGAHQAPNDQHAYMGSDGKIEKPRRIEIVCYRPAPLHFLRYHYRGLVEDSWLLMTNTGDHATTVRFAKQRAREELQVRFSEWKKVPQRLRKNVY